MKKLEWLLILNIFLYSHQRNWPMFHYDKENTGLSRLVGRINQYILKWSVQPSLRIDAGCVIEDVNNDGNMEVIIGTVNDHVVCINGQDGSILWDKNLSPYRIHSDCGVADFDSDGKMEIMVPSNGYAVHCLNGEDGSILWQRQIQDQIISPVNFADLDNDGKLEIVFGGWQNGQYVYCLNGEDGSELWKVQFVAGVRVSPAIADIDEDGKLEVIACSSNGYVYAINGEDGSILWTYYVSNPATFWISAPAIADLDNDNKLEIVFGTWEGRVFCLSNTGSIKWVYQLGSGGEIRIVGGAPAIGDIDLDGIPEVIIGSESYITGTSTGLHAFKGNNGSLLWTFGLGLDFNSAPSLCDINGDGYLEIIAGTDQYDVYCVNRYGSQLWVFHTDSCVKSSPAIGDIDNDGFPEIVFGSQDRKVYALDEYVNVKEPKIGYKFIFKNLVQYESFTLFNLAGQRISDKNLKEGIYILKIKGKNFKFLKIK